MQRIKNAAIGITLALATTAVSATSFDATRGTYDDESRGQRPYFATSSERAERPERQESAIVEEPAAMPVAREELEPENRAQVATAQPRTLPQYDPRHPHTGPLIDRGLFNRTGPNDFGG